jgi:hypothetical protein
MAGSKGKRFTQLLGDPGTGRIPRDVEMQDAPPIMADNEETVENSKIDGGDGEEIHRRDGFSMIA